MKVLKDEVRQRIVNAARDEFLSSGYLGASMRTIASQAGMTVGNIYLYFDGKEQLFDEIVKDTVTELQRIMWLPTLTDDGLRQLTLSLHSVFISNRVEFMILITRSAGSKYENYKGLILETCGNRLAEQFSRQAGEGFFRPLSVALVEGLLDIFNRFDGQKSKLNDDIIRFLNYMMSGLIDARRQSEALPCEE